MMMIIRAMISGKMHRGRRGESSRLMPRQPSHALQNVLIVGALRIDNRIDQLSRVVQKMQPRILLYWRRSSYITVNVNPGRLIEWAGLNCGPPSETQIEYK